MLATSLNYVGAGRRSYSMHTLNYGVRLDGLGQLTLTPEAAREELVRLIGVIKAKYNALAGWDAVSTDDVVVMVGEDTGDPSTAAIVLSVNEAAEIEAAADRLARDIREKTGVTQPVLENAGAYPRIYMAPTVSALIAQMRKLKATHSDATGAAEFPTSIVVLTILGVTLIGGLTVWGVAKRGKRGPRGPRGPRARARRRRR